jgi:hypothetical protein
MLRGDNPNPNEQWYNGVPGEFGAIPLLSVARFCIYVGREIQCFESYFWQHGVPFNHDSVVQYVISALSIPTLGSATDPDTAARIMRTLELTATDAVMAQLMDIAEPVPMEQLVGIAGPVPPPEAERVLFTPRNPKAPTHIHWRIEEDGTMTIATASDPMAAADEAIITGLVYEHAEDGNLLRHDDGTERVLFLGMAAVSQEEA